MARHGKRSTRRSVHRKRRQTQKKQKQQRGGYDNCGQRCMPGGCYGDCQSCSGGVCV